MFGIFLSFLWWFGLYAKPNDETKAVEIPVYPKAKWTVAVYMNGDNELETSITGGTTMEKGKEIVLPGDFHFELAAQGSNPDIHVVALVDRSPDYSTSMDNWNNSRLYYIKYGDFPDNNGTYWTNGTDFDELNMANAHTLTWFIETVQKKFPSDHLYLSLWDHNWGWHAGWFQKDETSKSDTMDYTHLYQALLSDTSKSNSKSQGKTSGLGLVDLVGYDACVAAQIEVLHTWRPFSAAFVGSQDYVGWGGVDYSAVVSALRSNASLSPAELAVVVARSMLTDPDDHCASAFSFLAPVPVPAAAASSANTSAGTGTGTGSEPDDGGVVPFDGIVAGVDTLAGLFLQHLDAIRDTLVEVREQTPQTPHYPSDEFHRDLRGMALGVADRLAAYPDVVQAAAELVASFDRALLFNEVVYRGKGQQKSSCQGGSGMTIYWTRSGQRPSADYLTTSFALATQWDEFLQAF
jgi:hypothetical protein